MRTTFHGRSPAGAFRAAGLLTLLLATLTACQSITAVQRDGTFTLQVGDRARVDNGDFVVRFLSVPQDSRCPVDAQCVWAGDGVVRLELVSSGYSRTTDLHTNTTVGAVSAAQHGYVVELIELTPAPRSGQVIDQGDYTARLRLSQL